MSSRELIILGNGPSLREVDFSDFSEHDTLGMNAAYRYWERINWRPTYYTCLDDALIDTHKDQIRDLTEEGRISGFFLSGRILDYFPEMANDERVRFLDEYVAHWHSVRGARHGLRFRKDLAFVTSSPNMLTTGSYSVRFGAALGYELVRLFGIDLTYRPIDDARQLAGNRLVMDSTPASNPNYFFDDYQRAGDQFHVPNPAQHETDLHLQSFVALRDDFIHNRVPTRIINASRTSRLNTEAILPCEEGLDRVDRITELPTGIALVANEAHHDKILNLLWLWTQPAFFPLLGTSTAAVSPPALALVCRTHADAEIQYRVRDLLGKNPNLARCFGALSVVKSVENCSDYFTLEYDCFPLRCDWLRMAHFAERNGIVTTIPSAEFMGNQSLTVLVAECLRSAPETTFIKAKQLHGPLEKLRQSGVTASIQTLLDSDCHKDARLAKPVAIIPPASPLRAIFAFIPLMGIRAIRRIRGILRRSDTSPPTQD